jgi:hypothetical protein
MPSGPRTRVVTLRLGDLVKRVLRGQVRVPQVPGSIDRDDRQLQLFLDNAARGYPIGHLLVWQRPAGAATVGSRRFEVPEVYLLSITSYGPYAADRLAFALGGTRRFEEVTLARFDRLATRAGLDPDRVRTVVIETVVRLRDAWPLVRGELPVPAFVADHITGRLATLPLLRLG